MWDSIAWLCTALNARLTARQTGHVVASRNAGFILGLILFAYLALHYILYTTLITCFCLNRTHPPPFAKKIIVKSTLPL